jgi:hypothetical protein
MLDELIWGIEPGWELVVPALTDPDRLAAFTNALSNWNVTGYVQFELTESAHRWIKHELNGVTLREIARLMHEHVAAGNVVDEVPESRPEWRDKNEYHYDLRLVIHGKAVYIETRLHYRLPVVADESWLLVVNIHAR